MQSALDQIERPDFDFPGVWFRLGSRQAHLVQHLDAKRHCEELVKLTLEMATWLFE